MSGSVPISRLLEAGSAAMPVRTDVTRTPAPKYFDAVDTTQRHVALLAGNAAEIAALEQTTCQLESKRRVKRACP